MNEAIPFTIELDKDGWAENFPLLTFPERPFGLQKVDTFIIDFLDADKTHNLSVWTERTKERNRLRLNLELLQEGDVMIQFYFFEDGSDDHKFITIEAIQGGLISATARDRLGPRFRGPRFNLTGSSIGSSV